MHCSNCGQAIKKNEITCPHCQSTITPNPGKKQFAVANVLEGILLLLMGVMVLTASASLLLNSMDAGTGAINAVFQADNLWAALWQAEAGVYNISSLLEFFSYILWGCGGLFLILTAMISFSGSEGFGLVLTAECFILAGLAASIAFYLIRQFQATPSSNIWDTLVQVWASDWLFLLIQLIVAAITTTLCFLKQGAKRLITRLSLEQKIPPDVAISATPMANTPSVVSNQAAHRPSFQLSQDIATIYHKRASLQAQGATHPDASAKTSAAEK